MIVTPVFSALVLVMWVLFSVLGYVVGRNKGRAVEGAVLGLVLGLIGVLITAALRPAPARALGRARAVDDGGWRPSPGRGWEPAEPGATWTGGPQWGSPPSVPAGWYPDPSGRWQHRWWDGTSWSGYVASDGISDLDPPSAPAPW